MTLFSWSSALLNPLVTGKILQCVLNQYSLYFTAGVFCKAERCETPVLGIIIQSSSQSADTQVPVQQSNLGDCLAHRMLET